MCYLQLQLESLNLPSRPQNLVRSRKVDFIICRLQVLAHLGEDTDGNTIDPRLAHVQVTQLWVGHELGEGTVHCSVQPFVSPKQKH